MAFESDVPLRSPWWVIEDVLDDLEIVVRGMRVGDDVPLTRLENVGGMRILPNADPKKDQVKWIGRTPAAQKALGILEGMPWETAPVPRAWGSCPDSAFHRDHLGYLRGVKALAEVVDRTQVTGVGRYSAVLKDVDPLGARAIFDLRWTNGYVDKDGDFSLLGVGAFVSLLRAMGNISGKGFRCLHTDVKNCYYQMPIGKGLGLACCLRLGELALMPTVLPMGFTKACFCAQSIMWDVLLRAGPEGTLGVPVEFNEMTVAPGYIPLEDGGIVVLVYDSILIIASPTVIAGFEARIRMNAAEINMMLKYITVEGVDADFVFCGVRLLMDRNGLYWALPPVKVKEWKLVSGALKMQCTPRCIFALAGILRFAAPILGWEPQRLGRVSKLQSSLGNIVFWDKPCEGLEGLAMMKKMIAELPENADSRQHGKSHIPKRGRRGPLFCAVDATLTHWSACVMEDGKVITRENDAGLFGEVARIGVQESIVLAMAIEIAEKAGATHVVVASDNTEAGRGFARGYGVDDIDGVISMALQRGIVVIVADIGTDFNIGDVKTRPDKIYTAKDIEMRTKQSWECMRYAWKGYLEEKIVFSERTGEWK